MEISLPAELEKELDDLAVLTGRSRHELVADAVASYLNELAAVRELLDQRYDEVGSGPGGTDRRRGSLPQAAAVERSAYRAGA